MIGLDGDGRERREIEHTAAGVQGIVDWLRTRTNGDLQCIAVATIREAPWWTR